MTYMPIGQGPFDGEAPSGFCEDDNIYPMEIGPVSDFANTIRLYAPYIDMHDL